MLVLAILCLVAPFVVGSSLLLPVVLQYRIEAHTIDEKEVGDWLRYAHTNRETIRDVDSQRVFTNDGVFENERVLQIADAILDGRLEIRPYKSVPVSWPFDPEDLFPEIDALHLPLASFIVGEILLEAYARSSQEKYFEAARQYALAFLQFERSLWLPKGFILNDHAVALRSMFLARLLKVLADHPNSDLETTGEILEAFDRLVALLAKPRYFTYGTNHGLMQNLAVMHAGIVAPELPAVKANLQKVFDRTDLQLQYLVSESGIVTEHSAGYQGFNVALVASLLRYASILGHPIPDHWVRRYRLADEFYRHLKRPDETLPRYGDTIGPATNMLRAVQEEPGGTFRLGKIEPDRPREPLWLDEDFGYWSEWRNGAHLLIGWADFGARAHKHANELSLIFWWEHQEWWTSGGYWPSGHELRSVGTGWNGSNAPHVDDEPPNSERSSDVIAWYSDSDLSLLHLKRSVPSGSFVHRVVTRLFDDYWMVIDSLDDDGDESLQSVWPIMSDVDIEEQATDEAVFRLHSEKTSASLDGQVLSGPGTDFEWFRGNLDPFAGWTTEEKMVKETSALVLQSGPGSWHGLAWRRTKQPSERLEASVKSVSWRNPKDWAITIATHQGDIHLSRSDSQLILDSAIMSAVRSLNPGTVSGARQIAESAYASMRDAIPAYHEVFELRLKIFKLALIAGACQLVVLLIALIYVGHHTTWLISSLTALLIAHISFGFWLHLGYLAYS